MKKSILILGGTGAMGKHLVDILDKSNEWNIYVTSRQYHENYNNVNYILGNALENEFVKNLCQNRYDAIVDFMNYNMEQFENNLPLLLPSSYHYLFLSSCRVFNNHDILTEESTRLLDTIDDEEFLKTQRYALRKARQEDILHNVNYNNWTIIRPYITYSDDRLQLGVYEKEEWLYRLLNNKPLLLNSNILNHYTTLTYGYDVAYCISKIINNKNLYGEELNITTDTYLKWQDVLDIYLKTIKDNIGIDPQIFYLDQLDDIELLFEGGYNTKYDRLWNRKFDNSKLNKYLENFIFLDPKEGLKKCLTDFLISWKENGNNMFKIINLQFEEEMDNQAKILIKNK